MPPSGRPAIGADMLLELRHRACGLGPMPGIVDARRHLVGDQRTVGQHEELDADHPDIIERLQNGEGSDRAAAAAVSGEIAAGTVEECRMPARCTFSTGS